MTNLNELFAINDNPNAKGFYNDINKNQITIVEKLKQKIIENQLDVNPLRFYDRFYLRVLHPWNFNLENAYEMTSKYCDWRKKEKVDLILYFDFPEIDN